MNSKFPHHPDCINFTMSFRDAVLNAMDECAEQHGYKKITDGDLPELFRTVDPLAEKLWLRALGYEV